MKQQMQLLVAALIETGALCVLSYLMFLAGRRLAMVRPGSRGHVLWHLIRLPGNFIHELSHAVVLTAVGYRVIKLQVSLMDRHEGRGAVYVRGRWHPLVPAPIGWALGAMAPLAGGIAALVMIAHLLHVSPAVEPIHASSMGEALLQRALGWLGALDFRSPATYGVLLVVFSIAAELCPSEQDLRSSLKALVAMASLAAVSAAVLFSLPPGAPARLVADSAATAALTRLMAAQEMALSVVCGAALLLAVPLLVAEALRAEVPPARTASPTPRHRARRARQPSRLKQRPRPAAMASRAARPRRGP